jgi:archaellin
MNHKNATLAIAAIVAAVAITAVAFAVPQQALAYGHHNHNHHSNSIKVSQDISQLNACSQSLCLNNGTNSVDIGR